MVFLHPKLLFEIGHSKGLKRIKPLTNLGFLIITPNITGAIPMCFIAKEIMDRLYL